MPAESASWELRKGIILRLGVAIATLVALMLAWYAVNSDEPHAPFEVPTRVTPAAGTSAAGTSKATTAAPSITAAPAIGEEPALPIGIQPPQERKVPNPHDPLHSEGIIRTLHDAEKTESQHVSSAPAAQATAKPKLPSGSYVQVGVFSHPANAEELKSKLEAEGIPVVIATRIQVGPFKSKKEAEEMRKKLKAMGMAAIVINQ